MHDLEKKKQYDEYMERIRTARYTCKVCGKGDITHQQWQANAYVVDIQGKQSGTPKLAEQLVVCSPECRKVAIKDVDYGYLMTGVGIHKKFWDCRLDQFKGLYPELQYALTGWLQNPQKGLLFAGSTGTGKTSLVASLAYELRKTEQKVRLVEYQQLVEDANFVYDHEDAAQFKSFYTAYDYLIIDDFGKDFVTERGKSIVFKLFNILYNGQKKLIMTTNRNVQELADKIDERLYSRLSEMCIISVLTGDDLRLKKNGA